MNVKMCVLVLGVVAVPSSVGAQAAQTPPIEPNQYTVFSLAEGKIRVLGLAAGEELTSGKVLVGESYQECPVISEGTTVFLKDGHEKVGRCPLFKSSPPANFVFIAEVRVTKPSPALESRRTSIAFDPARDFGTPATYDGTVLHLASQLSGDGNIVGYFSAAKDSWQTADANGRDVRLELDSDAGRVFVRSRAGGVWSVNYIAKKPRLSAFECEKIQDTAYLQNESYTICIDQANPEAQPRITRHKQTIIPPNAYGKLVIRHWTNVIPNVVNSGTGIGLTTPGLEGATASESAVALVDQAASKSAEQTALVSTILIPPHAPGAFHLAVKFADATDPTKVKAETSLDLIVDKTYVGALRVGIAKIWGAADHIYSARLEPGTDISQIAVRDGSTTEIVLGYSLYLDGLRNGRTYALKYGTGWQYAGNLVARHLGLYVGFGALSVSGTSVDFLKSMHFGLEIELNRNLSIATTIAVRRVNQLPMGFEVGGPAPKGDIPIGSTYDTGCAIVFNLSLDFFRFATQTTGASK